MLITQPFLLRLLFVNIFLLTLNAVLVLAVTLRLWPPLLIVAVIVEVFTSLVWLSWQAQKRHTY